jgi:hypothetical protein
MFHTTTHDQREVGVVRVLQQPHDLMGFDIVNDAEVLWCALGSDERRDARIVLLRVHQHHHEGGEKEEQGKSKQEEALACRFEALHWVWLYEMVKALAACF